MNKIILQGRTTKDIEVVKSKSEKEVARFTLAVPRKLSKEKEVDFIECVAFGNLIKPLTDYVKKGNRLLVEGNLQISNYTDKDGNNKSYTHVVVNDFYFIDYNKEISGQEEIPV